MSSQSTLNFYGFNPGIFTETVFHQPLSPLFRTAAVLFYVRKKEEALCCMEERILATNGTFLDY